MQYVNVWLRERLYGGPEEGGWFYDSDTPLTDPWNVPRWLRPRMVRSRFAVGGKVERPPRVSPRLLARARAWAKQENAGRYPLHSVLSEGEIRITVDPRPSWEYPVAGRPHYE